MSTGRPSKNVSRPHGRFSGFKLSDRSRFALRWLMAYEGSRDMTTLLEDIIEARVDEVSKRERTPTHWQTLFHPDEAVATLSLFGLARYRPTPAERLVHHFVVSHPMFFFEDEAQTRPHRQRAMILWPRIKELAAMWEEKKGDDHWCAAREMAAELKKHGEPVPKSGGRW